MRRWQFKTIHNMYKLRHDNHDQGIGFKPTHTDWHLDDGYWFVIDLADKTAEIWVFDDPLDLSSTTGEGDFIEVKRYGR